VLKEQLDAALAEYSPTVRLTTVDELGWPRQAVEPAAFALLAHYRCQRWPANLPVTTGANRSVLLGQLAEP
jgi:anhydro-N-acetylmuramic acid kinase